MDRRANRKKSHKVRNTILVTIPVVALVAASGYFGGKSFFADHFLPGRTFMGKNMAFKSLDDAKTVFADSNKSGVTIVLGNGKKVNVNQLYQALPEQDYQAALNGKKVNLTIDDNVVKSQIAAKVQELDLNKNATPPQIGAVSFDATTNKFDVAQGTDGTEIDLTKLEAKMNELVKSDKSKTYSIKLSDYLLSAEVNKAAQMVTKINNLTAQNVFTLAFDGSTVALTKADVSTVVQSDGSISETDLETLVTNKVAPALTTLTKPIYWKNPTNQHIYKFTNNQDYGNYVDVKATAQAINAAMSAQKFGAVKPTMDSTFAAGGANLQGFSVDDPITANFVWVDTDTQQAELWTNGKQYQFSGDATNSPQVPNPDGSNDTPTGSVTMTLTGTWDKGQATPSGFTTMGWKTAKIQMQGWEPQANGGAGGTYSVPIEYADCLEFRPFDSPSTGNHEGPYETGIFIHQSEQADGSGVKPDSWFAQYQGWQNIKNAPVGVASNGCIGLPASTAKIFYDNMSAGFPVIITGTVYDSAGNEAAEGFTGYDKPHENPVLVK